MDMLLLAKNVREHDSAGTWAPARRTLSPISALDSHDQRSASSSQRGSYITQTYVPSNATGASKGRCTSHDSTRNKCSAPDMELQQCSMYSLPSCANAPRIGHMNIHIYIDAHTCMHTCIHVISSSLLLLTTCCGRGIQISSNMWQGWGNINIFIELPRHLGFLGRSCRLGISH